MSRPRDVLIIGGGIIGCSIAIELANKGITSTIVDKGNLLEEASTAAAGMLGAHVELHSPGPLFELCKKSRNLYRTWTDELTALSGISAQYIEQGILRTAFTEEDEAELRSRLPWIGDLQWLSTEEIRRIEPAITKEIRGGLYFNNNHQIQPRCLAASLKSALAKLECTIKPNTPVIGLIEKNGNIIGVRTTEGNLYADAVILSAGAWSSFLLEPLGVEIPIFPVKGQCYSIKPASMPIKETVFTKGCYLVPKMDGSLLIGASQQQVGFNKQPTLEAIQSLHETATTLVPALKEAEFLTTWTGLRPGTPDGLPYMGQAPGIKQLFVATGHYRNGILLAPITGRIMAELVGNGTTEIDLTPFSLERSQPHFIEKEEFV